MEITYKKGDATKVIVHICNDIGGWGKGFVKAISKRWKEPEKEYRQWFADKEGQETSFVQYEDLSETVTTKFMLENVQFVQVSEDLWIANMIAQKGIKKSNSTGQPPIRYDAVSKALQQVKQFAKKHEASIHMPRIGFGLAGGKWEVIEKIIYQELIDYEIETLVYDFE